ncbi:MAG: bacillithiol system redox-active protein YtxJ [Gemmatimonadetes bacterium]|nr:bacillithiol system redox-active protein YtxJ [Gemmatimonadota bacterium]
MNTDALRRVRDENELDGALAEPVAVIYKHSPLCGLSAIAAQEVRSFVDASPGTPVYLLDVIRERSLAREVERRLGIRHESPQAIVVRAGEPVWNASHRGVTAEAIRAAVA